VLAFAAVGTKILFADDDALVSRIYRDKLAEEGFDVAMAEDGVVAMRRLLEFRPDVVVLDLLMPKMTGGDVLKFIRQHPELRSTRVIVFSNSFLSSLVEQVGSSGVEETLPKSTATPQRLIELIRKVLASPPPGGHAPAPLSASAKAPAPATSESATTVARKDEQFRTRVQAEFVQHLPAVVADIRKYCSQLISAADTASELARVEDLSRKVGFLTQMSTMAGNQPLAQLASALELLLFHLHEKGAAVDASCRHTITTTVAFLAAQLEPFTAVGIEDQPQATVLVVDDDAVSNRGILHALVHANVRAVSEMDPQKALERLRHTPYELILLDIELPGMDGLELCEQIRTLRFHQKTPVVFITSHNDIKTRSRAILSGGNDFICKPILPIELTAKVITEVLRGRFARQGKPW
jgi:CheY-like chemotaxis protein